MRPSVKRSLIIPSSVANSIGKKKPDGFIDKKCLQKKKKITRWKIC
jgi:hypothetical protein